MKNPAIWALIGGIAVTIITAILDLTGHRFDDTLVAAITTIVSFLFAFFIKPKEGGGQQPRVK